MSMKLDSIFRKFVLSIITDNVDTLNSCLTQKECENISFFETKINEEGETLLHLACHHCKPNVIEYLLNYGVCNPLVKDVHGNTPLHLMLKSVLAIDDKQEFLKVYLRVILVNLPDLAPSLNISNNDGETPRDLLELADSVYQYHLETDRNCGPKEKSKTIHSPANEEEWTEKLNDVLEDEYCSAWGKYEEDYLPGAENERESYDSWADRMLLEYSLKYSLSQKLPTTKNDAKPSLNKEDQNVFLEEEKTREHRLRLSELAHKRFKLLSKLKALLLSQTIIKEEDLPFDCSEKAENISKLILLHIEELNDRVSKRKALRELQRLWHPDKFCQKFGERLSELIKVQVLAKVTEISQYINSYVID